MDFLASNQGLSRCKSCLQHSKLFHVVQLVAGELGTSPSIVVRGFSLQCLRGPREGRNWPGSSQYPSTPHWAWVPSPWWLASSPGVEDRHARLRRGWGLGLPSPELGSSVTLGLWPCHFLSQPLDFSMHEMQKLLSDLEAWAKQAIKKRPAIVTTHLIYHRSLLLTALSAPSLHSSVSLSCPPL